MVGYDPDVNAMPKIAYGIAGGMSGFLTRAVTQPLDVLKIRLQVHYTLTTFTQFLNKQFDLWLRFSFAFNS